MKRTSPFSAAAATFVAASLLSVSAAAQERAPLAGGGSGQSAVLVTDYFPAGFVKDGSISYLPAIQLAVDEAARTGRAVMFPPLRYRLDNPAGIRIASGLT